MADPLTGGGLDAPLLLLAVVRAFILLSPGGLQVFQEPVSSCSRCATGDHSASDTSAAAAMLGFA